MSFLSLFLLTLISGCSMIDLQVIPGQQGEHLGACGFELMDNGIYKQKFILSPKDFILFKTARLERRVISIKKIDKIAPVEVLQFYHEPGLYQGLSGDKYTHQFYVGEGINKYKNTGGKLVEVEDIQEVTPSVSTEVLKLKAIVKGKEYTGYTLNYLLKDRIEGCDWNGDKMTPKSL